MKHISDQVSEHLTDTGWFYDERYQKYTKRIVGYEPAGTISDGTRVVSLTICEIGRYLSRIDGWGKVIKDVDLRNYYDDPVGAVNKVLEH